MAAVLVRGRDDVLTVMRQKREERGLTHLEMDAIVGLGSGHYGKLERMGADWGKQAFRMTGSIASALDALDLEIIIAPKGEIDRTIIARDVRLILEPEVQLRPRVDKPGLVSRFRRRRFRAIQAEKKEARRAERAQRAEARGATC